MRLRTFGGLWIEDLPADAAPRPRALALLAMLAAAGAKGASRDRILGVLWPEAETERARHALSQTIYSLRKDLGLELVVAAPDLRLDASLISSDVAELQAAVRGKEWREAAALYTGPFLEGFYLADAPEFERWVETERSSLAADALRALEQLAKECATNGRDDETADVYRRLVRLDPVTSRYAVAYMEALDRLGDRTGALAHGKAYADHLKRELEIAPDRDVQRVIARLRDAESARGPAAAPARVAAPPEPAPVSESAPPPIVNRRRMPRRTLIAAVVVVALAVGAALARRATGGGGAARPVVAVGRIRDVGVPDSAAIGGVLSEMLATSLSRVNDLQVIANSRMLELTPRGADTLRSALTDAARRAGATEMIEGELIPLADHQLRLDIRRVDIARGLVLGGYQLTGDNRIALFDSAAAMIAGDFRLDAPTRSLADVSTRSPIAYRYYEDGLRAFYQFDALTADHLFRSAVREDSSFAMAMYYAWRSAVAAGDSDQITLADLTLRLASRASERDALLIRTHVGVGRNDIAALAAAETLATRYPRDPEALTRAADAIPDVERATSLLNRSIALDSASGTRAGAICRLCDALNQLVQRYGWADSLEAAERTLRRWSALRPDDPAPLLLLSDLLLTTSRGAEGEAAMRRAVALGGVPPDSPVDRLALALRTDDLASADSSCTTRLAGADSASFGQLRWYCLIGLRMEGRYREALGLASEGRVPHSIIVRHDADVEPTNGAILDLEMGRPRVAAAEFRALGGAAVDTTRVSPGTQARDLAWHLTLSAAAWVDANDTAHARALVDSIETVGRQSWFPRDPLLHHFVRGLLFARAQRHADAVRELRASIYSPTNGYTRANYELGRELLVLHRPAEGIPVVRAALHGGIEGAGLYVTRTEMHELLAQLFDAAGQRDSAAAHFSIVARAWSQADAPLRPRRDAAMRWLAQGRAR